jgi:ABC-type glycerol-3-phosphate transport system permease component
MEAKEISPLVKTIIYSLLIILLLTILYPIIWMTITALKTPQEIASNPFGLPKMLVLDNFIKAWQVSNFGRLFVNSLFITVVSVTGLVIFCSAAAYAFAVFDFKGSKQLFIYFLVGMMIPPQVILIPSFKIIGMLHLQDNYLALFFTYWSWVPFAIFFLRATFLNIPKELVAAARIDGCSEIGIFWKIMIPLAMPGIVTVAIFYFVWIWNDFLWPLIYIRQTSMRTITLGLMGFQGKYTSLWNLQMAALSLATWPPLIFYLLFRNRIQKGLTEGAIKF